MRTLESFENFIAEYYISASPGSVVVPGEWYKDNVNSVNYVAKTQPLPQVIDPMFETNEIYKQLDELSTHKDFIDLLADKNNKPREIIDFIKTFLTLKGMD